MISLFLEIKGFDALLSVSPTANDRIATAWSFKDETLAMTTTELIVWYIVLMVSLIKPGGFLSVLGIVGVLMTGFLSVIYTQITFGYIEQSGATLETEYLKMAALLNTLGLFTLLAYSLDRLFQKIPGFD
jgi:hypothetical protein